jgi:thiol-disulfide isomerase/thioredoxin
MKKKIILGALFLFISALMVMGAFYLKNYMMLSEGQKKDKTVENYSFESVFQSSEIFYDYNNNQIEKSAFINSDKVSVTIIHFWASWCEPCITEIPELLSFVSQSSNNEENNYLKFIIVSLDENQDDLVRFLKNFPQLNQDPIIRIWDNSNVLSKKFSIDKLPGTIFWYKNGEVKKVHGIVDWKSTQL